LKKISNFCFFVTQVSRFFQQINTQQFLRKMNIWEEQKKKYEQQEKIIIQDRKKGLSETVFLGDILSFFVENESSLGFLAVDG
jgi:hypothetical protein